MIHILLNQRWEPLEKALYNLAQNLSQKFDVYDHREQSLQLYVNKAGVTKRHTYYGSDSRVMIHFLQLTQSVRGFGLDNVLTPRIFAAVPRSWTYLQQLAGESKVKAALAFLGGYKMNSPKDMEPVFKCDLEQLCQAFAMHIEDERVPIDEWLEMTHA